MGGFGWDTGGGGGELLVTKEEKVVEDVLHEEELSVAGTFDVQNISQDYDDLVIEGQLRSDEADTDDNMVIQLNGDGVNGNYVRQKALFAGAGSDIASGTDRIAAVVDGNTQPTGTFSTFEALLLGYTGAKNKFIRTHSSLRGRLNIFATLWVNTDAVNRIQLLPNVGTNFIAGSKLVIRGRKKQQIVTDVSLS